MADCEHYWIPRKVDDDGNAIFHTNRHMSSKPITNAKCSKCNARTWFTKAQWQKIPAMDDPTEKNNERNDN